MCPMMVLIITKVAEVLYFPIDLHYLCWKFKQFSVHGNSYWFVTLLMLRQDIFTIGRKQKWALDNQRRTWAGGEKVFSGGTAVLPLMSDPSSSESSIGRSPALCIRVPFFCRTGLGQIGFWWVHCGEQKYVLIFVIPDNTVHRAAQLFIVLLKSKM